MTLKIKIRTKEGKNFFVPVPLAGFIVKLALHFVRKKNKEVPPYSVVRPVIKELKRFRKRNGSFIFVEAESEEGEKVKISL